MDRTQKPTSCGAGPQRKGEQGQVAVLFALTFTFMFVIFAMVVDFAHLINNKINLQLSADQAAYAGAAHQARILNRISMVNYRLRQNLKEFAMRANVTHLRHNRNFPRGSQFFQGPHQAHRAEPFMCQQAHGYLTLSGLRYAQDTNLCRNASPSVGGLPPIVVPPVIATFDPFAQAIAAQIGRIQQAANQECRAAANDNRLLAQHLVSVYEARSQFHSLQVQELADYLNSVARETPGSSSHPVVAAAFNSAQNNLTLSNQDNFRFEILQPEGNTYLDMETQQIAASLFYFNFSVQGNGCVGRPAFLDFNNMIAGVSKVPEVVTYFAVKLTSQPRMLFMPSSWVANAFPVLEAYAAAKPFGSRLGPPAIAEQLAPLANRVGNRNRTLNFSVRPNDRLGLLDAKLMAYLDALHPFNGVGRPQGDRPTGWPDLNPAIAEEATRAIRAPTVFDALFYSVFPDPGNNLNRDYVTPQFAQALYPDFMEASDPQGNLIDTRQPSTRAYFPTSGTQRGQGWVPISAGQLPSGAYGTYGHERPFSHSVTTATGLPLMNGDATMIDFGFAPASLVHSGWAPDGAPPRIGYSVKMIGMDALRRSLRITQTNGSLSTITNPPTGDRNIDNVIH